MHKINSIWILGSTSEIAQEICIQFARNGCKKFFLIARDKKKNQKESNKKNEDKFTMDSSFLDID